VILWAILWAALLVALLALFLRVSRRMSTLAARTHDLERIQAAVDSIDRRLAAACDPLIGRLDAVRRRSMEPADVVRDLEPARAMLQELAVETRELQLPALLAGQGAVMIHETERAVRAADLVAYGLDAMLAVRGNRDLEAQTSLKRGALNLRHARESFARAAAEIAALQPTDLAPDANGVPARPAPRVPTTYGVPDEPDLEGPFEPRM